ncbi:carbohydrate ABC transporter permease [Eubacteriales bacterium OttesenSCG-928-N13]|nr:carbohydrate ABC transporter permease [Eubacteriales bacterium OttesenSCG-928-N13]
MVTSRTSKTSWIIATVLVSIAVLVCLTPLIWMILGAFKRNMDVIDPTKLFSLDFTLENMRHLLGSKDFFDPLWNSLTLTGGSLLMSLAFGLPAAYAFARFRMRKASSIILVIRMIPAMTFMLPWFIMFRTMGIAKTHLGLLLAFTVSSLPLIIWIMMPYFQSIPYDITESARIDGASEAGTFAKIILPLSLPGIMTVSILTVIGVWNNFLFVMILGGTKQRTLPMQLMNYIGESSQQWGKLLAAATVITLPLILIAVFMQKYIVSGMTSGAVKG